MTSLVTSVYCHYNSSLPEGVLHAGSLQEALDVAQSEQVCPLLTYQPLVNIVIAVDCGYLRRRRLVDFQCKFTTTAPTIVIIIAGNI